jgi:ribosomal protein S18 acetylase RimI-like enzyme
MTITYPIHGSASNGAGVIRRAAVEDLPGIVSVHKRAFSQFFLTRLGAEFLRRYYALVLEYHAGIVFVCEGQGAIQGFVCGFMDPPAFYRFMWNNKRAFVVPLLSALIRRPSLAAGVFHGVQRIQTSASGSSFLSPEGSCELSSIAVAPEAESGGLGSALIKAFLEQAWRLDAQCIYLSTDADGNIAANALYRKAGFRHDKRFLQRRGRWMNSYLIRREPVGDSRRSLP